MSYGIAIVTRLNLPGCLIQHLLSLYSVGNIHVWMSIEYFWTDTGKVKPMCSDKILSQYHFIHHTFHANWPGIETRRLEWCTGEGGIVSCRHHRFILDDEAFRWPRDGGMSVATGMCFPLSAQILLLVTATFIIQEQKTSDKKKTHSVKCTVIRCDKSQIKTTKLFQSHFFSVNVPNVCGGEKCNLKYTFIIKITKEKVCILYICINIVLANTRYFISRLNYRDVLIIACLNLFTCI
jgi:hypothetical protein